MRDVNGKRVLVVGLARSGQAVARALQRHGAQVTITDLRPPAAFQEVIPGLLALRMGLELGCHQEATFLRQDAIVVSPGVPWDLPQLRAARERRILVVPEVEAATWFLAGTLVGITGSNGKTTTSTLLGKMLEAAGLPVFVGGNIGVPLSAAVGRASSESILVTELSSFQLEAIQEFRPHVGVFLNLSPNHLDRHPSLEAYAQAKRQIFRNQRAEDFAVLNADDSAVAALAPTLAAQKVFFSWRWKLPNGVFLTDDRIVYRVGHLERVLFERREVGLRGDFNLENVLAATAAACVLGADFQALRAAVKEFRGVEHRLEFVREICAVEFFNDSKATSVDATAKSLETFDRGVHLILGGKDKGAPYAPLRALLEKRVRNVLVIGAAAGRITRELAGAAEIIQASDLETAVREAFKRANPGDVVLLAPACSSFDQFQDFEHRGRVFKELVLRLAEEVDAGKAARPPRWAPVEAPPAEPGASHAPKSIVAAPAELPGVPPASPEQPRPVPQLVWGYEVGAEELPPAGPQAPADSPLGGELGTLEAVRDTLLPFEARPGQDGANPPASEPKDPAVAVATRHQARQGQGQRRLPGMD